MQPALFDTSIYVSSLRMGKDALLLQRRVGADAPLWLSSVVLEELYAGAGDRQVKLLERMEREFGQMKRILVPNLRDWIQTGRLLARLAAKYGYEQIGQGRLTNDALIAMSAARSGIQVCTANQRDFQRLAEFRTFQWKLISI